MKECVVNGLRFSKRTSTKSLEWLMVIIKNFFMISLSANDVYEFIPQHMPMRDILWWKCLIEIQYWQSQFSLWKPAIQLHKLKLACTAVLKFLGCEQSIIAAAIKLSWLELFTAFPLIEKFIFQFHFWLQLVA